MKTLFLFRVRLRSDSRGILQLRDIEILVQAQLEVLEGAGNDDETLREIQKILYSTEVREIKLHLSICPAHYVDVLRALYSYIALSFHSSN